MIPIWVTTPKTLLENYEEQTIFVNLRRFNGNVQESFSELEAKIYGEVLNQMQKIYTDTPPPISAKDNIYFSEPASIGTNESFGDIYPQGAAVAEKPKSQYIGISKPRNPTYTNIKFIPIQGVTE